jgi:REP element-mobilizing transposase RayT
MARPLRIELPGAYYHVMNRGLAHHRIFAERGDRHAFLQIVADCTQMWGLRVLAYCLLDTHYHLLVQTPEANLARVMRHVDGVFTQRYNRRHERDGPLFRGRYRAILVDGEAYLLAVARYIHQNPVAAGLVRSPEAYEWSSCRLYVKASRPPAWLDTAPLLGRFPRPDRQAGFLAFMKAPLDAPVRSFYERMRPGTVLGGPDFVDRIRRHLRRRRPALPEVPEAATYLRPDVERCLQVVTQVCGTPRAALLESRRGHRNEARALAIFACRRLAGLKLDAIARLFRVGGYSAVGNAVLRTERELARDGALARKFARIRERLGK